MARSGLLLLVPLLPLAVAATQARAQDASSVNDIINSLKPTAATLHGPTRGIRPVVGAETEQAPEAAIHRTRYVSRPATEEATPAQPSRAMSITFRTGSADLSPMATDTLDRLGQALTGATLASSRFRIEGHTDTVGDASTNRDLSERRAQAVTGYLEQKFSIPSARLEAVGVGMDQLLVKTPPQTPEPRNRRVNIVNLSG